MIQTLPKPLTALVTAQNQQNATAYAAVFAADATVHDEGKDHHGRASIEKWIDAANKEYQAKMEVVDYSGTEEEGVMTAKISGTFDGSPVQLKYNLSMLNGEIISLRISG